MLHTGSLATYVTTGSLATYVTTGSIIPITAAGNNSNGGYTLLNPTNQYQLRALKGGNYISLAATNTDITIDGSQNLTNMFNSKQDKITVTGNDSVNNFSTIRRCSEFTLITGWWLYSVGAKFDYPTHNGEQCASNSARWETAFIYRERR
jgi:aconitase B